MVKINVISLSSVLFMFTLVLSQNSYHNFPSHNESLRDKHRKPEVFKKHRQVNPFCFSEEMEFKKGYGWINIPISTLENRPIRAQEKADLQAVIPDFQVNENGGVFHAEQNNPSIGVDAAGNFVVVWGDWRNGNKDIYAQRYSSDGTALGPNFKVNDDSVFAEQHSPSIGVNAAGNFVVVWEDGRNGDLDIYAQRYSSDGTALGPNFKVNDDNISLNQYLPSIGVDAIDNFVIVWEDMRNDLGDIYAQRYSSDGIALGPNFRVNNDSGSAWQHSSSVGVDASGNFVVTWEDGRNADMDVYAQRYSSDGTALGVNFKVNDDSGGEWQGSPSIEVNAVGNFVIVWMDGRNDWADIYAQRYSSDGTALGPNFKVNDDSGSEWQGFPSIGLNAAGSFVIVWTDMRNDWGDIYAQRYSSDGTALGSNFKVNDDSGIEWQSSPSIGVNIAGNFFVVWEDGRNDWGDIYAQRYSSDGTALGSNFKVNDDIGFANQDSPSIGVDAAGNFIIVWKDWRNAIGEIYAQRYSSDGTALGANFMVNDDSVFVGCYSPSIGVDATGNFVVVWKDERNGDGDIYAQRYTANGTAIGTNFKVNDDNGSDWQSYPSIGMNAAGNFVVVWRDERNSGYSIYAQRYNAGGTALGANFKVNDDSIFTNQHSPSIGVDAAGNFIIVWMDHRNGNWDIYAQCYSADGTALGANFKVNDDNISANQYLPSIGVDAAGNFIVAWMDKRNGERDIYAQRYNAGGTAFGANFMVSDDSSGAWQESPSIGVDATGNFVVVWEDYRNDVHGDIYSQRYGADGNPIGQNFLVTKETYNEQFSPDVQLKNGLIYNTWVSNHVGGTGYDIWANVLDWNNPTVIIEPATLVSNYILYQNYPNPFNPTTTISYALPNSSKVELVIYNPLGQRVRTLVQGQQASGQHQVQWNGRDDKGNSVASGVYVYRLQAKSSNGEKIVKVKKMVLLR